MIAFKGCLNKVRTSLRSRRQHKAWGVSPRKGAKKTKPAEQAAAQNRISMSDSYTNLLYHIVFSTKDRRPLITPDYEVRLHDYIGGMLRSFGGISLELRYLSEMNSFNS